MSVVWEGYSVSCVGRQCQLCGKRILSVVWEGQCQLCRKGIVSVVWEGQCQLCGKGNVSCLGRTVSGM